MRKGKIPRGDNTWHVRESFQYFEITASLRVHGENDLEEEKKSFKGSGFLQKRYVGYLAFFRNQKLGICLVRHCLVHLSLKSIGSCSSLYRMELPTRRNEDSLDLKRMMNF